MSIKEEDLINCGERSVQKLFRVALRDICQNNGIKERDVIEVFIKKVEKNKDVP